MSWLPRSRLREEAPFRTESPGVELRGINKRYPNGIPALTDITLWIEPGELITIVGPSGSGKSTLLRLIAGLEQPTSGQIRFGLEDVTDRPPRERDVAMVFQRPAVFPYQNVFQNLAFGLRARGTSRSVVRERVAEVAGWLGLTGLLRRRTQTLSGGERQRVALGRVVARRPGVFLLDEPLTGLDGPLRSAVREELLALHGRLRITTLYVTHDQGEAMALGDRAAVLESGRLVQVAAPRTLYERPADRFVAGFIGSPPSNLFRLAMTPGSGPIRLCLVEGTAAAVLPETSKVEWLRARRGTEVVMGIRPEQISLARSGEPTDPAQVWFEEVAAVRSVEYLGHETLVGVSLGGQTYTSRQSGTCPIVAGEAVSVGFDPAAASWFEAGTGRSRLAAVE